MRKYEDINFISQNREPQRSYYIPEKGCILLNGEWTFKFFEYDFVFLVFLYNDSIPSRALPVSIRFPLKIGKSFKELTMKN